MSGNIKPALGALIVASLVVVSGCQVAKKQPELARDPNPPAFGENGLTDVASFLEGKWSQDMSIDPETAKALGLKDADPNAVDGEFYWEFHKDGTMLYTRYKSPDKITGKWFTSANGVQIQYLTFNDEPLSQHMTEVHQKADTGTQSGLAEDMAFENTMAVLNNNYYFELSDDKKSLDFKIGVANNNIKLVRMKG